MKINFFSTNNFCARNLKPLSDFNGPVLKLTKEDIKKIEILRRVLANYELQAFKIRSCMNPKNNERLRYYYNDQLVHISMKIEEVKKQIKYIKVERYRKQKEALK